MVSSKISPRDRLILALDQPDRHAATRFVELMGPAIGFYKVGWVPLLHGGLDLVRDLCERGKQVFLDLKLFDVPQTVEFSVRAAAGLGASFVTVHGNRQTVRAAVRGRGNTEIKILSVIALTSFSESDVRQFYQVPREATLAEHMVAVAKDLAALGSNGFISSPQEVAALRAVLPPNALIVVPGIRLQGETTHDHERTGTPYETIRAGADYLVVGRSIYQSDDPPAQVERFVSEIERGMKDRVR